MSAEKIKITEEEAARATPSFSSETSHGAAFAGGSADYASQPYGTTAYGRPGKKSNGCLKFFLGAVCMLVVLLIAAFAFLGSDGCDSSGGSGRRVVAPRTTADVERDFREFMDAELKSPDHPVRQRIENSHLVSVTSAHVYHVQVVTFDGTALAGRNDENVMLVKASIYFNWEGMVNTGHTILEFTLDTRAQRVTESRIVETTALINLEDPELWFDVGCIFGELLFGE